MQGRESKYGGPMRVIALILCVFAASCGPKKESKVIRVGGFERPTQPLPPLKDPPKPGFVTYDFVADQALINAQSLSGGDNERVKTRFLTACHLYNTGVDVEKIRQGVDKFLNSISLNPLVGRAVPIGNSECTYRINTDDFNLGKVVAFEGRYLTKWQLIEQADVLQIDDADNIRIQNLQFLLQTRRPILLIDSVVTTVMEADAIANDGNVYYAITEQAIDNQQLFNDLGINVQREYDEERALFEGNSTSLIALGKTRGYEILTPPGFDGALISSFDSDQNAPLSHFELPFTPEAAQAGGVLRSDKVFIAAAGERFIANPNGFYRVRLDANGKGEVVAPATIVSNTRAAAENIDTQIRLGDCTGCHTVLVIPIKGELYNHVRRSTLFNEDEKNLAKTLADPTRISAKVNELRRRYTASLVSIDNDPNIDSITEYLIFPFRRQLDAGKVCAYTFTPTPTCLQNLAGTTNSSVNFGNVLQNGRIPLQTFQQNFDVFQSEMQIAKDRGLL